MTIRGAESVGGMSLRRGLVWSRAERMGPVSPQSAPTAGSSQARPELVGVVVVVVHEVRQQEVAQGGEAVGHAGRDVEALVDVTVELDHLGRPVGARADPKVVQDHPGPAPRGGTSSRPGAGGSAADQGARLLLGAVALDHLAPEGEPAASVGLDEATTFVAVDIGPHQHDVVNDGEGISSGIGANGNGRRQAAKRPKPDR